MAYHYETVSGNQNYCNKFKRIQSREESKPLKFRTIKEASYNKPFTILEMQRSYKSCPNKAPGSDKITYNMIKQSHRSCQELYLEIVNKIWKTEYYPSQWKSSIVLSFPKPNKPSTKEENYRPISLTSCAGKIMEKMVNARLSYYLESRNLIPANQFGFRKMQGTQDALLKVTSDINTALDNQLTVLCVSFDLKKAYDTTWRYGILKKLLNHGIHNEMFSFIKNFMSDRRFNTKIGSTLSTDHTQEQGVPQGSVLSCTLFSVAINDILECIPSGVEGCLYVDDLLIYCSGRYLSSLERRVQTAINKVNEWATSNGFTFSSSKTASIHFHRKRSRQEPPSLNLNGSPIMHSNSIKYLGMILDRKMSWREHITQLKSDTIKRLDLLKCLSANSWGADRTTMMRVYRAIIRSKLDYGCIIYGSAKENVLNKLDSVHNTAIRLCTGGFRSSPVCSPVSYTHLTLPTKRIV